MSTRSYVSILFLLFLLKDDIPIPKIKFEYIVHNRGDISEGSDGRFFFPFQNIGAAPLLIADVRSSCGCLVPWHNKGPVEPNQRDTIFAKYNTERIGPFNKTLTVRTNADVGNKVIILRVAGRVLPHPINEIQVRIQDSTQLHLNEFNKAEMSAKGQKEFTIYFANISADTVNTKAIKREKALFESKDDTFTIAPRATYSVVILRNEKAENWYSTLIFELDNGKRFSIDVLK